MEQEEGKKEVEVADTENQKKKTCFIGRCFNYAYRACYFLMALLIFLATLAMIGSALYATFHRADTDVVPTYKEYSDSIKAPDKKAEEKKVDTSSIEINKKFGDELVEICKLTGIEKTDDLVQKISSIEKRYREPFVHGLLRFLKDAKKADKEYKPEEQGRSLLGVYEYQFREKVDDIPRRESQASDKRKMFWSVAGVLLYSILMALVLPLLIQIERNTRKE